MQNVDDEAFYDDLFWSIVIYATRYSLGRRTYAPHDVMSFVRPLIPCMDNNTLFVLKMDIGECLLNKMAGDPNIDEPEWSRFYGEIDAELETRKRKSI